MMLLDSGSILFGSHCRSFRRRSRTETDKNRSRTTCRYAYISTWDEINTAQSYKHKNMQ